MATALLTLFAAVAVLATSRVLRGTLGRMRQPAVMAEVLAGLLLGASVLGALPGDLTDALFTPDVRAILTHLGEVALVVYVFRVGVELDTRQVRREGRAALLVGVGSFLVPAAGGAVLALAVHGEVAGNPPSTAFVVFLATAFGVTAFPVLARIVDARGLGDRPGGRVALAAAAGQELLVWPLLGVALALGATGGSPGRTLVLGAAVLAAVGLLSGFVVPAVVRQVAAPDRPTAGRDAVAGLVALAGLGVSAWATQAAGLHLVLGAFVYGIALARQPRQLACALLRSRPAQLGSAICLPLFFALPALRIDVWTLGLGGLGILALVLVTAFATKLISATVAARAGGLARPDALAVGALMNARGLVELVVLSAGLSAGLIDVPLFTAFALMAITTSLAAGPLVDAVSRRAVAPARPAARR